MSQGIDYQGQRAATGQVTGEADLDRLRLQSVPTPSEGFAMPDSGEPDEHQVLPTAPAGGTSMPVAAPRRRSEADKLEDELDEARRLLPIQSDPALAERLTPAERRADQRTARRVRAAERRERRRAQLAAVRRDASARRAETRLAGAEQRDRVWAQQAEATRRRLTSPVSKLARLHLARQLVFAALIIPAMAGIAAGAVNVQGVIASYFELTMADALWWLGYGIEPLLTLPLAGILIYQAVTASPDRGASWRRSPLLFVEIGLLVVAVALNVVPHLGLNSSVAALIWSLPPVMIATTLLLLPWLADGLNTALLDAQTEAELSAPIGRVEEGEAARLLRRFARAQRLDRAGQIGGERDENGLPSVTKIREALARYERIGKAEAAKIRDAMAELG